MKTQRQEGLTLVEVLVALAIFGIVSAAVLSMFPTILHLNRKTRADQAVTIAAKQFMESARVKYGSNVSFQQGTAGLPDAPAPGGGYTCERSAAPELSSSTPAEVLVQRVTLSCAASGQPTYTFSLDLGKP